MVMFQEVILAVPYTELCWEVEGPQFDVDTDIFPWLCFRRLFKLYLTQNCVGKWKVPSLMLTLTYSHGYVSGDYFSCTLHRTVLGSGRSPV